MDSAATGSTNCLPAGVQIGEYRVLDVIGEGGFGIVYRAKDLALDREVAIKEYMPAALAGRQSSHHVHVRSQHRGAFDAGLRSFINEARLLARFSHPTLVHVYRFFEAGGTAYMVMRLYEGQTLRHVLDNPATRLNQETLCALLAPLLDVLEVLHAEDCFHRDIAPDNIFVQHDGSPVLLDFGAARRIIGDMTQALTMVLKPGFAPIEQYVDDGAMPQGAWTDVYQVGALMHMAVTGKPPATSVARMVSDPLQRLTAAQAPGFTEAFLHGMHCALAVQPQERPQSIAQLRLLLGLPSSAQTVAPPSFAMPATASLPMPAPPTQLQQPTALEGQHAETHTGTTALPTHAANAPTGLLDGVAQLDIEKILPAMQPPPVSEPDPAAGPVQPAMTVAETTRAAPPAQVPPAQAQPETQAAGALPRKRLFKSAAIAAGVVVAITAAGMAWFNHSQQQARAATLAARDGLAWQQAQSQSTLLSMQDYLDSFPEGRHRAEAQTLMQRLLNEASLAHSPKEELLPPLEQASATPEAHIATSPPASQAESQEPVATAAVAPVVAPQPPETTAKAEARKPAVAMGKVHFRISPWGYVSVNRAAAKTSPPMTQMELPEGEYRIDISNPGAGSVTAVTKTIQVKNGEPVTVRHLFE